MFLPQSLRLSHTEWVCVRRKENLSVVGGAACDSEWQPSITICMWLLSISICWYIDLCHTDPNPIDRIQSNHFPHYWRKHLQNCWTEHALALRLLLSDPLNHHALLGIEDWSGLPSLSICTGVKLWIYSKTDPGFLFLTHICISQIRGGYILGFRIDSPVWWLWNWVGDLFIYFVVRSIQGNKRTFFMILRRRRV